MTKEELETEIAQSLKKFAKETGIGHGFIRIDNMQAGCSIVRIESETTYCPLIYHFDIKIIDEDKDKGELAHKWYHCLFKPKNK